MYRVAPITSLINGKIGSNNKVYSFIINHKPTDNWIIQSDGIQQIDIVQKRILYFYKFTINDDNLTDSFTVTKIQGPNWFIPKTSKQFGQYKDTLNAINADTGTYNLSIEISDNNTPTMKDTISWILNISNNISKKLLIPTTSVNTKIEYNTTLSYTGGSLQSYLNSIITKPSWLSITKTGNKSFTLSGTPTKADSGIKHIKMIFTDSISTYSYCGQIRDTSYDTLDYNLTVNYVNTKPINYLTSTDLVCYKLDTTITKTFACYDAEFDSLLITLQNSDKFTSTIKYRKNGTLTFCTLTVVPIQNLFINKSYTDSILIKTKDTDTTIINKQYIITSLLDTVILSHKIDSINVIKIKTDTLLNDSQQIFKDTNKVVITITDIRRIKQGVNTILIDTIIKVDTVAKNTYTYNYIPKILNTTNTISFSKTYKCTLSVIDKDNSTLIYSYITDTSYVSISKINNIYTFTSKKLGNFSITLTVNDGKFTSTYIIQVTTTTAVKNEISKRSLTTFFNNNSFSLEKSGPVSISIYNIKGQLIYSLNETKNVGTYTISPKLTSGFYIYKINLLNKLNLTQKQIITY